MLRVERTPFDFHDQTPPPPPPPASCHCMSECNLRWQIMEEAVTTGTHATDAKPEMDLHDAFVCKKAACKPPAQESSSGMQETRTSAQMHARETHFCSNAKRLRSQASSMSLRSTSNFSFSNCACDQACQVSRNARDSKQMPTECVPNVKGLSVSTP